jgi:hypothetical protein
VPGAVALIFAAIFTGTELRRVTEIPSVALGFGFILFIVLAYVLGMCLDCISGELTRRLRGGQNSLSKSYLRYLWGPYAKADKDEFKRMKENLLSYKENDPLQCTEWQGLMRERVILSNSYGRSIVPKMTAEEFLLKNLACAGLLLGILQRSLWASFGFWATLILLGWAGFFYRARQTALRTSQLFELLLAPEFHRIAAREEKN